MALAVRREPDIIIRTSIPLEATSDQPLASAPAPPVEASNDPADQLAGVAKEMTAEELAASTSARKGAGPDADPKADGNAAKPPEADDDGKLNVADPDIDNDTVDKDLPGWAQRQVLAEKRRARDYRVKLEAAVKAKVGEPAWDAAVGMARDKLVQAERERAEQSIKEAKEAKAAAEAARKEADELRAKVTADPPANTDPRPTRDAFDDPDLYDDALTEWGKREGERLATRKATDEKAAADAEAQHKADEQARADQEAAATRAQTDWMAKVEKVTEKYPDYIEATSKTPEEGGPTINQAMIAAMMQAENGPEIAYHLAQDTEESVRIANLPNVAAQIFEIGRLAERLSAPARRRARAAPIEPIDTSRAVADNTDAEPDMEAYAAKRMKQLQTDRRPFFPQGGLH